ncbi:MAG: helix-turn-helix transcriptional regulator [Myxococcaceae bacterium]|nr:helix-turn-helix transcriptional regulator [Myxococcaceae bacterium]
MELFDRPMVLLRGRDVVCANQLAQPFLTDGFGRDPWRLIDAGRSVAEPLTVAVREGPSQRPTLARLAGQWRLTQRECEVLERVAAGASNKDIANDLDCSERTVEVHVSRLLAKSHTTKRTELLARCWALGAELDSGGQRR